MKSEETPEGPAISPTILQAANQPGAPALSLEDLHGMEVLGSVPVWVLGGLRLHRKGWKHLQSGWVVGVYVMDISCLIDETSAGSDADLN